MSKLPSSFIKRTEMPLSFVGCTENLFLLFYNSAVLKAKTLSSLKTLTPTYKPDWAKSSVMPSFPGRISNLIFNEIRNPNSCHSLSSINTTIQALLPFKSLKELRRFSSSAIDGQGGEMKNRRNTQQQPPDPLPNRPLRGGRKPFEHHRPRVPQFPGKNSAAAEKLMDDPSDANSFLEKFKLGADKSSDNKRENPDRQQASQPPQPPPPADADEIFNEMKKKGLIPNAVAMLDGLCKDGLVQEAMKLFGLMREKGTIPEVVIYTAVVEGFCKAHKLDKAKNVFRKMQSVGIVPNAFSYSVLIQGLCSCKNFENAVEFCLEMLEAGHSPNASTFVGLINGLCTEKGVEEAQSVVKRLTLKNFVLNDKAVRDFLNKNASVSPLVWEAIFGKKTTDKLF